MAYARAGRVILHPCFLQDFGRSHQRARVKKARPIFVVPECDVLEAI